MRKDFPRSSQVELVLPENRDPVGVIRQQNLRRLTDLLAIRSERMMESPFSYFRGAAAQMSIDLAAGPSIGLSVLSCADSHLGNFGFFASHERSLVFDLNDFDESEFAPFDWDVRRLATSANLSARAHGLGINIGREAALASVQGYHRGLRRMMKMTAIDRFYAIADSARLLELVGNDQGRRATEKAMKKARARTGEKALRKFAVEEADSGLRLVNQPPLTRHSEGIDVDVNELFNEYLLSVRSDVAMLLSQYTVSDWVLRVVGVGSVGTLCFLVLLTGPKGEPLLLQVKEATESVVTAAGGLPKYGDRQWASRISSEGERVVRSQQVLQSVSDSFLGWMTHGGRDYYWRQFRDMKGSYDLATLDAPSLIDYARVCGEVLARAHSQSPAAADVDDYLGSSDSFAEAIADWSAKYSDVTAEDHALLVEAVKSGKHPELGVVTSAFSSE